MRDLSDKAPGTFNHSIQVANLAEAAASEINANVLLIRVGALYHDIGKIKNPLFFSENQLSEDSPHDRISPEKSAQIILNHVKDGVEIARSLERYSLTPGQLKGTTNADGSPASDAQDFVDNDISAEPEEVRSICNALWTQSVKDSFKAALIADLPSST